MKWGVLCFALVMMVFALVAPPHAYVSYPGPNHNAAAKTQQILPVGTSPPQEAQEPSLYKQPCRNTPEDRQSDLCAQWKAVDWTKLGTIVAIFGTLALLFQIRLGWEAVKDTGEAARAMERQNELTEAAQRPWVRLSALPKLIRRYGADGLYLRVDFLAENIGKSPATHFDIEHEIMFREQTEKGFALDARIRGKIEAWKADYTTGPKAILAPNDTQNGSIWDDYAVPWWDMGVGTKTAHPVLLAAVFYRTPGAPEMVQLSWRSWYLVSIAGDGSVVSWIPFTKDDLGPDRLCVEPFLASMAHEEYKSKDQPERRKNKTKMRTDILPTEGT